MVPKILYQLKDMAGKSFRPSNGTEGMIFEENFCSQCIHEKFMHTQKHGDKQCDILNSMVLFEITQEDYPVELVFSKEGWPVCTNWKKWDWGDDDDLNEPPPPPYEPQDPGQLTIFTVDEFIEDEKVQKHSHNVL